jgi:hypothetical protein
MHDAGRSQQVYQCVEWLGSVVVFDGGSSQSRRLDSSAIAIKFIKVKRTTQETV